MLLFKRLLTSFLLFIVLSIILFVGSMALMGGIAGAMAAKGSGATNYNSGYTAGQKAGREMGKRYGGIVLLGVLGVSTIASLALSFSSALPWCRPGTIPPPLP